VAAEAKKTRAIDPQAVVESLFIYARSPQTQTRAWVWWVCRTEYQEALPRMNGGVVLVRAW